MFCAGNLNETSHQGVHVVVVQGRLSILQREPESKAFLIIFETFFDEIRNALERGELVKLSGFGNFQLRDKPQRPGRNPKTGEEIPITARRVVTFHASQKLKSMVELASQKPATRVA